MHLPKKSAPATEIKNRFGDYLKKVTHQREPLTIEKNGRPVAVLVDSEQWIRLREAEEETKPPHPWVVELDRLLDRIKKNHPDAKPFSAVELVRQIRDEEG
ncbi:MAG: type II toxin-antitoxin system Phd/YefM family antitoxin [Deltaproteobacteria bacterium]|nr:type II toxin-antitoxin system Phd/YefM family antitoxin [Deltaproteobacteria bacterium]